MSLYYGKHIIAGNPSVASASYDDYGVVKIGKNCGLSIDNGILCVDFNQISPESDLTGRNCDIAYTTPRGLVKQGLLNESTFICENDSEIESAKSQNISFKTIYDTWQKSGRYQNKWYGYTDYPSPKGGTTLNDYGYPYWYYDDSISTIVQPKNTQDDSFYVSNQNYENYDITIRCYSNGNDDDTNGFIISYVDDGTTPTYLAAIRSPKYTNTTTKMPNYHWYVSYDCIRIEDSTAEKNVISVNNPTGEYIDRWNTLGTGTLIRIRREQNIVKLWTTPFVQNGTHETATNEEKLSNEITIDLSKVRNGVFNKSSKIGYITNSQPNSMYENIKFNVEKSVVDIRDNTLSVYNPISKTWTLKSTGFNTLSSCGFGRLVKNELTQKVFYVNQNTFSRINANNSDLSTETWTFALDNGTFVDYDVVIKGKTIRTS